MDYIYPGQIVRIKTIDELCEEFGLDEEDFKRQPDIGGYRITTGMQDWLGCTYKVYDYDSTDGSVYLYDTEHWWPKEVVELVSEPGEFCGFKVGDLVEFRQYEDMVADGSIAKSAFVIGMKHLCGKRCTITELRPISHYKAAVEVSGLNEVDSAYCFDTIMFEHVEDIPEIEEDDWSVILVS